MKNNSETTVIIGMSGGVDSSVAAFLLKQQGYKVIGLFMNNWEEQNQKGECTNAQDYRDVASTCAFLDIPHKSVNFAQVYWDQVFEDFLQGYKRGEAPNPDLLCNQKIKFKTFFEYALSLGADYVATGHYCCTDGINLRKGMDSNKDQSYFLSSISGRVLDKVLFPLGKITKNEVRKIAKDNNIPTYNKKESMGICFVGKRPFKEFLSRYITSKPGNFCTLNGDVVGTHQGCSFYTIGQRRSLGLGGPGDRWYVVDKDMNRNIVYVARGSKHPALFCDDTTVHQPTWIKSTAPKLPLKCKIKVRHRQADQNAELKRDKDNYTITFSTPQRGIAPGQAVAFYVKDVCLGSAMIKKPGQSYYALKKDLP